MINFFQKIVLFLVILFLLCFPTLASGGTDSKINEVEPKTLYEFWQEMSTEKSHQAMRNIPKEAKELVSQRAEFSKTYNLPGEKRVVLASQPLHYEKNGDWHEIKTDILSVKKFLGLINFSGYEHSVEENSLKSFFPANFSQGLEMRKDEYVLKVKPLNAQKGRSQVQRNQKTYLEVWDNVDVQYIVNAGSLKEFIILNDKTAPNVFEFEIETNKRMEIKETEEGLTFFDPGSKDEIFLMQKPFVFDRNSTEPDYDNISWSYQRVGRKFILRLELAEDWLKSNERSFPVVIDPTTTTITANSSDMHKTFSFSRDKEQIIKYHGVISLSHSTPIQFDPAVFRIRNNTTGAYIENIVSWDKGYNFTKYTTIKANHSYTVTVQAKKWRHWFTIMYGTTTATLTFYDPATLTPILPDKSQVSYYKTVNQYKWSYSDKQSFTQQKISILIQRKNPATGQYGKYQEFQVTTGSSLLSKTINFSSGEYRWAIKGYNSKLWSDYSSWKNFRIDKDPPFPRDNKLNLVQSLNVEKNGVVNQTELEKVFQNNQDLRATVTWNQFQDVASGLKKVTIQYQKNQTGNWINLSETSSIPVGWNSIYQYRVIGEDQVGNISNYYYSSLFGTPALPTEIESVSFDGNKALIDFQVHGSANGYKIAWKDTVTGQVLGKTDWITNTTGTVQISNFSFAYGKEYEFVIATTREVSSGADEFYFGAFKARVPNNPPVPPTLVAPEDGKYLTQSTINFTGNPTTDPEGQQIAYTIIVQKESQVGQWSAYKTLSGYIQTTTLNNGYYRWRLEASDGLLTSYSTWRYLTIDTISPVKPTIDLLSLSGQSIEKLNTDLINVKITNYTGSSSSSIYPSDTDGNNDIMYFIISSNYDEPKRVEKADLIANKTSYQLKPINGEHKIRVTAYDRAGNSNYSERSVIFDNQKPATIQFSEPLANYFNNSGIEVTFNWPQTDDQPVGTNSGIAKYILEYKRPATGESSIVDRAGNRTFTISLNPHEEIRFKVWAVDEVGNIGNPSSEVIWHSLPEATLITDQQIVVEEISPGIFQQKITLNVKPVACSYYRIYRQNLTPGSTEGLFESEKITGNWKFTQIVAPHQTYKYYCKTYNSHHPEKLFVTGSEKTIMIANHPPTKPTLTIAGGLSNGYLKHREVTLQATSDDYDNDDLRYQYILRENGQIKVDQEKLESSFLITGLSQGANYQALVGVSDAEKTIFSDPINFVVDTEGPLITLTPASTEYVANQNVAITANDAVSEILELKYKWGDQGNLTPINSGDTIAAPHGANQLIVFARDVAGNESRIEQTYLVDQTAPLIDLVKVQDYEYAGQSYITSNAEVYLKYQFSEDLTTITAYRYGLLREGQNINDIQIEELPERQISGLAVYQGDERITGNFIDGQRYYPVLVVYNKTGHSTGLIKISPGFIVDGSRPEITNLELTGLVQDGNTTYLTDLDKLGFAPVASDPETGISQTSYGLVEVTGGEPQIWHNSFTSLKQNLHLEEGKTYYLVVRAKNGLGLLNKAYSSGFTVDTKGPEFTTIIGGQELPIGYDNYIQRHGDYLEVTWAVEDLSSITAYYYKIGTASGSGDVSKNFIDADAQGWVPFSSSEYAGNLQINQPDFTFADDIYYVSLKAVDAAGNTSNSTTNGIEVNTTKPPVPTVKTDGLYAWEKDRLHFFIEMKNQQQDLKGYHYRIITESGVPVLHWQWLVSSEKSVDIMETNVDLEDGKTYYLEVQAEYLDGSKTDSGWANVTIDSTPPSELMIVAPQYAPSQQLAISWQAEEDYSSITYQLKVGTTAQGNQILDWMPVGQKTQHIFNDLEIDNGTLIYITLMAENASKLSSVKVSAPIIIDNTPPPTPLVLDDGMYTIDDTYLKASWHWSQEDPQSGIRDYQAAVLTSKEISDSTQWVTLSSDLKEYRFDQNLVNGLTYFIAVKSTNQAGLSSIGFSDGILVDTTKPEPPTINDFGDYVEYVAGPTTLIAEFTGAKDPESGLAAFYYSLGTQEDLTHLVNNQEVFTQTVGRDDLLLELSEIYFFEAIAKNNAGEVSAATQSDGIMVVKGDEPRISKIEDGGEFSTDNQKLVFVWEINDPTVPFEYYEYALLTDQAEPISSWQQTNEKRVELLATEVFDGQAFQDGETYYLAVRVVNKLLKVTQQMISDGITVDTTPPADPILDLEKYVTNDFKLKWTGADQHSGIQRYRYAIGSTRGGNDLTAGWVDINLSELGPGESSKRIDRQINLNLLHSQSYYLTVQAQNGVGFWSNPVMSTELVADLEPPTKPVIDVASDFTASKNEINDLSFSSSDPLSGVIGYRYQVVLNQDLTGDLTSPVHNLSSVQNEYNNPDLDIDGLNLIEGQTYYLAIQTVDHLGHWSEIGYSQGITVDTLAAQLTFVDQSEELVTNNGSLKVAWQTNEAGTLFYRFVQLTDDGQPVTNPDFIIIPGIVSGSGDVDFTALEYGRYQCQMYQIDRAGNLSETVTKNIRYNSPPVVELLANNLTAYKGQRLQFTGEASDKDGQVLKYCWSVGSEEVEKISGIDETPHLWEYTFTEIGDHQVTLLVEDNDGGQQTAMLTVTITNTLAGELLLDELWSGDLEIQGTVEVPEGITLTITAATEINFPATAMLRVYGQIQLQGEVGKPIIMTGTEWKGVEINPNATVLGLSQVVFDQAERGLTLIEQNPIISDVIFSGNTVGLHLYQSNPRVLNCQFIDNLYFGVKEDEGGNAVLEDCVFTNNQLSPYYDEELTWITVEKLNTLPGNSGNREQ